VTAPAPARPRRGLLAAGVAAIAAGIGAIAGWQRIGPRAPADDAVALLLVADDARCGRANRSPSARSPGPGAVRQLLGDLVPAVRRGDARAVGAA
jgi:hypothetical protein